MELFKAFIIAIVSLSCVTTSMAQAKALKYITFKEHDSAPDNNGETFAPIADISASPSKSIINLSFFSEVPDSVKIAVNAAKYAWESAFGSNKEIHVEVGFDDLVGDYPSLTEVAYIEDDAGYCCPSALSSRMGLGQYSDEFNPDAIIILSSGTEFDCGFSTESTASINLYSLMLRSFAHVLGFGSSIRSESDIPSYTPDLYYAGMYPSYFDRLIFHGRNRLTDVFPSNDDFMNYVLSEALTVETKKGSYNLYSPRCYVPNVSLQSVDSHESCLMTSKFGKGSKLLNIDPITIDILNEMGWEFPLPESLLKIHCTDSRFNGIISQNESTEFYLEGNNRDSANDLEWILSVRDTDGLYHRQERASGDNYVVDMSDEMSGFHVNESGVTELKLDCYYTVGDIRFQADPVFLSSLSPAKIISIENLRKIPTRDHWFKVACTVTYRGANLITATVEEDYSSALRRVDVKEPYIAHIVTGEISSLYYSWLTLSVDNELGGDSVELEFEPENIALIRQNEENVSAFDHTEVGCDIVIKDLMGNQVGEGDPDKLLPFLKPGVYIVYSNSRDGLTIIDKILKH